ncbi:hypothetical protein Tco_1472032, partial [Tanacetum coccineum]
MGVTPEVPAIAAIGTHYLSSWKWVRWPNIKKPVDEAVFVKVNDETKGFSLAKSIEENNAFDATSSDQPAAGLKANNVVIDGDDEVKVLNWVHQAIDVENTSDNDARDQASELETKVLVDGKQDDAKVVGMAEEQNSDEPNVLE